MPADRLALDAALDRLDAVFTEPPALSGPLRGCEMCWSDERLAALGGPPAEVPAKLVWEFVHEDVDHLDHDDQYPILWRRLAPRALRGIAAGEHDLDMQFGIKLGDYGGKLHTWPEPERAAVTDVLDALLRSHVVRYPDSDVFDVICGLEGTSGETASWLDRLDDSPEVDAGLLLIALDTAWWALWQTFVEFRGAPTTHEGIAAWLTAPVFAARLERHLAVHPDCRNALQTALAVADLRAPERAVEDGAWGAAAARCAHP